MPPEKMKELQWNKLKDLLEHAYRRVPFYQKRFQEVGITPKDIQDESDFQKFPFLTKEDIRANLKDMVAEGYEGLLLRNSTGGSTGEPLLFYSDRIREAKQNAAKLRSRKWWNIDIGDKELDLWGSPLDLSKRDWIRLVKDKLLNLVVLSAYNLSEKQMAQYLRVMEKFKPKLLYVYPSALYCFAQFLKENGAKVDAFRPQLIIYTAEALYEHQRKIIQEVFSCPIATEYGAHDGGLIAHQCPEGGLHIIDDQVYLEFLKNGQAVADGQSGEIVITNLESFGMPFIRYRIGDVGKLSKKQCTCGLGLRLMESFEGRLSDFLLTTSGDLMSGLYLTGIFRDVKGIKQFQIIQNSASIVLVKLVKDQCFENSTLEYLTRELKRGLGETVHINFEFPSRILPEKSGKYRWIISRGQA